MKSQKLHYADRFCHVQGMTLIEIMLYTAFLSLLLTQMIGYAYGIYTQHMRLNDDLYDTQSK